MSSDRESTRIVRSWLEEGVNVLPDRVLDDVLDRLPTTPQRRHWWQAWRNPLVNNVLKFALAGAAVLVLAVVGIGIYFSGSGGGPGGPGPTPSSTPISTPAASQVPADSQPPSLAASFPPAGGTLAPGRYPIRPEPFSATSPRVLVNVPAGYEAIGSGHNAWAIIKRGDEPTAFSGLGVWQVDAAYRDPCSWLQPYGGADGQSVGPTVDDFLAALALQPGRNPTEPVDVTVDGYSGKRLELSVPPDTEVGFFEGAFSGCEKGEYRSWPGRSHQGPSQIDDVRVLDVEGRRLIIATTYFPTTSAPDRAELDAMFQSLDIQP
jgi:hypothetical protein